MKFYVSKARKSNIFSQKGRVPDPCIADQGKFFRIQIWVFFAESDPYTKSLLGSVTGFEQKPDPVTPQKTGSTIMAQGVLLNDLYKTVSKPI